MTQSLYRDDAYLKTCQAKVLSCTDKKITLDQTVFFAASGGQPGDIGKLHFDDKNIIVEDTTYSDNGSAIIHHVNEDVAMDTNVIASLDWNHRYLVMRTHTALHLLYAAIKLPVTGGRVSPGKGRLDFDMPDPPDRDEIEAKLQEFINADAPIETKWVDWDYLNSNPELIKTMAVKPPSNQKNISLVEIKDIDIQACGGTHVKSTKEVGAIKIKKVEKKGRINRRVIIELPND